MAGTERSAAREGRNVKGLEDRALLIEILQGSPIPQFVIDKDHRVTYWNRALEKYSGIKAEDIVGTQDQWKAFYLYKRPVLADLLVEGAIDEIQRWYAGKYSKSDLIESAYEATDFFPHLGVGGKWLYFTAAPIRDKGGNIIGAVETLEDVTERKRAEAAIRLAYAYNRSLIEASLDPLVTIAPDGRITDVNRATETVTGFSRERLIGTDFSDYFTDPAKAREGYIKAFEEGSVKDYPLEIRHMDGHLTSVIYNASVYRDETGKVIGVFAAARDITERKRAQEALLDAKNQAELYLDLMGHDINNLNQVGIGYLEIALGKLELSDEDRELVARPLEALKDSSRLIANVEKLQSARAGKMKKRPVDAGQVLSEVISRYAETPDKDVTINYEEARCVVTADALLADVFSNIIGNAIKHSEGPVTIDVRMDSVSESGKKYCRVAIDDNGPGISDDLKGRIFVRYQRGKTGARGKGLGLYLVRTLVESYGGKVRVEDRVPGHSEKGARFVVTLPVA